MVWTDDYDACLFIIMLALFFQLPIQRTMEKKYERSTRMMMKNDVDSVTCTSIIQKGWEGMSLHDAAGQG